MCEISQQEKGSTNKSVKDIAKELEIEKESAEKRVNRSCEFNLKESYFPDFIS